ncbi:MAG TPA: xyloglucanase, partial [Bryobacteraceae bacterium]|nr:xyloglucanase [Bryobacteraceae bacterium]
DPESPGVIMVSTLDLWYQHDDIFRSLDGGDAWEEVGASGTWDNSLSPWVGLLQSATSPGWWMGSLAIDPFNSGHVMYGTGATIWSTSNATAIDSGQPVNWTIGASGLEETAVLQLISPPSGPANLLSGVGDIGGFAHLTLTQSPPAGMMANPIFSTTTGLDFAQSSPLVMARTGYASNSPYGAYSTDGGVTWTPFAGTPAGTTQGAGSIAVSADGKTFVWAPLNAPVAASTDKGTTWTQSSSAPSGNTVVADRVNPLKFYIASAGSFYRSTDGGVTFTTTGASVTGTVVASFKAEGDLWLASNAGLFHSTDSGSTFAAIAGVQQANSVGLGMAASGATYPALYVMGVVGNVQGFFRSTDAGATWSQINDAQHQYGNASLVIGDPRVFGRVYIGTNGRGIIYGDPTSPSHARHSSNMEK